MNVPVLPPEPTRSGPDRVRTDVAIVGAGAAGLATAIRLPDHLDVVIIDKGVPGGDSGSSPWAQGGMAVALAPDDSPELHALDTQLAGDGLCDPAAVAVLTREAPAQVEMLLELGARFDRRPEHLDSRDPAHLDLAREGGQRLARSVRRADATGAELIRVLREAALPRVARLPGIATGLARAADGQVSGVWVLAEDGPVAVEARAVVLATGGCGGLYAATTNPDGATGDALALGAAVGAALRDVEFVQFHPTGLAVRGNWRFLLTEALRGAGATLHDADGHRFLPERHPDAELAPRHIVAKAILDQAGATAYLDATHLGETVLSREFPTVLAGARRHGYDLAGERVPVTPAAHYQIGGVRTDLDGRSSLPGLYAVGEAASTGLHGANRMAGNSLTEALVFGRRAARAIAADLPGAHRELGEGPAYTDGPTVDETELRAELRQDMLRVAGPVRDGEQLAALAGRLAELRSCIGPPSADPRAVELRHALDAATLIVHAATRRTESRGGHWREDHPASDPAWAGIHLELIGLPTAGGR